MTTKFWGKIISSQESYASQTTNQVRRSSKDIFRHIRSDQSLSRVQLFTTPWITARQASLSITNTQSSPRLTSIESVMPSSHLILCHPLLLLPPIHPSIRVFSNESTLRMRWPKDWSFSFSIIGSLKKKYSFLDSFRRMYSSQTTRVQEQSLPHRKETKRIPGWHWRQQTVQQSEITMHPHAGVEWKAPGEMTSRERNYYFMCLNGTKRVLPLQWNIWGPY